MENSNSIEKHNITRPKLFFEVKHPCTCPRCRNQNKRLSKRSIFEVTCPQCRNQDTRLSKRSIFEVTCPQCRNQDTRLSKCSNGSFFNRVFRKAHSCDTCYARFWIFRPFRMLILTGVTAIIIMECAIK